MKSFADYALSPRRPPDLLSAHERRLNAKARKCSATCQSAWTSAKFFKQAIEDEDNLLIDTRMMLALAEAISEVRLASAARPCFPFGLLLLDSDKPKSSRSESDEKLDEIVRLFLRTGLHEVCRYLIGGMKRGDNAGLPLDDVGQMTVHEIQARGKQLQLLDVRSPDEWKGGHIPDARHIFLGELREKLGELDKRKPTAVYCDSGYRASIATSILKQEGFDCVCNVPGSWQAWKKAGYPVDAGNEENQESK